MKITFLCHCGFAVDLGPHVLLFDYCPRGHQRETDALLPGILQGREPLVFVSHSHGDHYSPSIYDLPSARYYVAEGVPAQRDAVVVRGGETRDFGDFTLRTFVSTDEGVAFLLHIDGRSIYHAGDLNWWHWDEESADWNEAMKQAFFAQAELLAAEPIDLAFLTADPRQRGAWLWGFDALMRRGNIRYAVPMHFWNLRSVPRKVLADPVTAPYRDRILQLGACGDELTLGEERFR